MADKRARRQEDREEQLESRVRARTAELSEIAAYLHELRENEKRILARALHDELGSILTAARLDISFIRSRCAEAHADLISRCDRIAAMLDQGAALKRRLIDELRPSTLDILGLAPAVHELVESFGANAGIAAEAEIDADLVQADGNALTVFRIIQEALTNVAKHAQASGVCVVVDRAGKLLHIRVRDNGKGFDPLAAEKSPGHGLAVMRQRVRAMGGKVSIVSAPGSGTELEVWLPPHPE